MNTPVARYEVLAQKVRTAGFDHLGSVQAPNDVLAKHHARWLYDQENWLRMYVVTREQAVAMRRDARRKRGRG